ncbi:DUF58 domain-containing protein [Luteimonas sp. RD2P54]|uniref:DUF58 domain-containing protein n=1 Tax=Luteimonas endophytica TaxID=3042023 RepID=A0ABT6JCZ5_9GAMM|nr:DUF58 domain-containing protein [Luteimonas endophytica]MDH5824435.1 DUF58 domain-containing protein [Luteimonas endophytica]
MYDPIPPEVRPRLRALRIRPRRAAGGRGIGAHHSRSRGAGLEFAQYRAYDPGDEPRQIDWKLYARSDRFFVREAERESPLTVWVLVDASASMGQADAGRPEWTRLDAARALAACIAEVAMAQGDACGLVALRAAGPQLVPPGTGPRQRDRLLLALRSVTADGGFPDPERLAPVWERVAPDDMVVLLSDCFDGDCVALAERLAAARREVLAVQVLTAEERDFPFREGRRFIDPETGEELLGDGAALRDEFLQRFGAAQRALQARFDAAGIRHAGYVLDRPLDEPLRRLFGARREPGGA